MLFRRVPEKSCPRTRRSHVRPPGASCPPIRIFACPSAQAARNLLMDLGQRLAATKFLLRDRDSRCTASFDAVFSTEGIRSLTSPPGAPRANAICERIIGTLRRELLDRVLVVNERHLSQVLTIYLHHFNTARPHRTLRQLTPTQTEAHPPPMINLATIRFDAERSCTDSPASTRSQHDHARPRNPQARAAIEYSSPTT
jgi:putative transposase